MAYEKDLHLLVVAEKRLRREAMLDSGHDIRPFWTELDPAISYSDEFLGYLQGWKCDVDQRALLPDRKRESLRELTAAQVISSLPWYELLALVATFIGALLAVLSIGYRLGGGQWPFA